MLSDTPLLDVRSLSKRYDKVLALHDLSLSVRSGEFVCLLGPNGSGKSTFLKLLAGSEQRSSGELIYRGQPLHPASIWQKELIMVWQSLALFPHMNVQDNVGFGLAVRGVAKIDRHKQIELALSKVGLNGYGARKVHQLSGGEQQRVALARALILKPAVLLLDEPFGAIDTQLRSQLQALLREIHKTEGLTIIMVTHDISEALALAEKIVVLDRGRIQQIGTADEMLHQPRTPMVAEFMGQKNVLRGTVTAKTRGIVTVNTAAGYFNCREASWVPSTLEIGQDVAYIIDASKIRVSSSGENQLSATLESRFILGSLTIMRANAAGIGGMRCEVYNGDCQAAMVASDQIRLAWDTANAFAIPFYLHEHQSSCQPTADLAVAS